MPMQIKKAGLLNGSSLDAPRERRYEEMVLQVALSHMIACCFSMVEKRKEIEVNPSMKEAADNAVRPFLNGLDEFTIARVAKRAALVGDNALKRLEAPNEVTRLLACAYLVGAFVQQGALGADSTLSYLAAGIIMEADDENDEVWSTASHPKERARELLGFFQDELVRP